LIRQLADATEVDQGSNADLTYFKIRCVAASLRSLRETKKTLQLQRLSRN
jgi:hypothetical protein